MSVPNLSTIRTRHDNLTLWAPGLYPECASRNSRKSRPAAFAFISPLGSPASSVQSGPPRRTDKGLDNCCSYLPGHVSKGKGGCQKGGGKVCEAERRAIRPPIRARETACTTVGRASLHLTVPGAGAACQRRVERHDTTGPSLPVSSAQDYGVWSSLLAALPGSSAACLHLRATKPQQATVVYLPRSLAPRPSSGSDEADPPSCNPNNSCLGAPLPRCRAGQLAGH
ncbi:hypothetical protein B0T25DRAFT_195812 [Lasiosphaeria hispida]|uniref:Uncharacterized protein n=1 Tax=Lasiosphaeria hispida TaxID=260671 RepID=A0AAJ0HI35_9PEZI|nr:hypothetical protein B0T25DRAFT_195812 [Lasiosphaeria hispida]